jgi:hypothetical protein
MKVALAAIRIALALVFPATFATGASGVSHAASSTLPVITKQPVNQTAKRLSSATFTVTVSGTPPLTYRWHRSDKTWPDWDRRSLTLSGVTENDVGTYTVTVTNAAGSVTSTPATLTLRNGTANAATEAAPSLPPEIPSPPPAPAPSPVPRQPVSPSNAVSSVKNAETKPSADPGPPAVVGETVTFVATADGSPPFKFQWKKDGETLAGETNAKLVLRNLKLSQAGEYVCVISNAAGEAPSEPFKLAVQRAPGAR